MGYPFYQAFEKIMHLFDLGKKEKMSEGIVSVLYEKRPFLPNAMSLFHPFIFIDPLNGYKITYSLLCFVLLKITIQNNKLFSKKKERKLVLKKSWMIKTENKGQNSFLSMSLLSFFSHLDRII